MKVLFLVTFYHPHWTGLTQYAKALGEGLAGRGWQVKVLTTKHEGGLSDDETLNGVKIRREKVVVRLSRTAISLGLWWRMVVEIQKTDRVVVFLPFAEVALVAVIAKALRKPLYLIYNGDLVLPKGVANRVLENIFDVSTKAAIRLGDGVIVNTTDYASHSRVLKKFSGKWIPLVPPLAAEKSDVGKKRKILDRYNLRGRTIIGFAGRFVEEKGFDLLIKSIPDVVKKVKGAIFVFAGETNVGYEDFFLKHKELIDEQIKLNNLVVMGRLDRKDMWAFYNLCSVMVITSRSDFFPFVQVEAMLSGVPIVVNNIPGARWLVKTTGMGELLKSTQPRDIANAIETVLRSKGEYAKQKKEVENIFNFSKVMDSYERIFKYGREWK